MFCVQMLSTVLNIIMFEDCRNQWSMSRPLLGLILINEEVRNYMYSQDTAVRYYGVASYSVLCALVTVRLL